MTLPSPEVTGCYFDIGFMPPIAAMQLRWPDTTTDLTGPWPLPGGETLTGQLPSRFGLRIRRQAENAYALALLWDSTYRQWYSLRRSEITSSALGTVLASMGTRLEYLLDQPVAQPDATPAVPAEVPPDQAWPNAA